MRLKQMGIYKIKNIINGRIYIGQSVDLYMRKYYHLSDLKYQIHGNSHLQRAYNKYGKAAFEYTHILRCELKDLVFYEQTILDYYRAQAPGVYNQTGPVKSPFLGAKHSVETLKKMSKIKKGKPSPRKGKTLPLEHKIKIDVAKRKPVEKICILSGLVTEFNSAKEAEDLGHGDNRHISDCCLKRRNTHRAYGWQFLPK